MEALVAAAQEELAREEEDARKIRQLVEAGAVPAEDLDLARLRVARARAQLMNAQQSIEDYRVVAPWPGVVSKVLVTDGDFVAPRAPLMEIYDPASLVVRFAVPEGAATNVKVGSPLTATLDAYPGQAFSAEVVRVYPDFDRRMRTRTAEAALEERVTLAPGMFVRLVLELEKVEQALVVPSDAITSAPNGERVIYVVEDGKAVQRKVTAASKAAALFK